MSTKNSSKRIATTLLALMPLTVAGLASAAAARAPDALPSEKDHPAPIDRGAGPGKPAPRPTARRAAIPATGIAGAAIGGFFQAPFPWPINAIHMALLPDGRILSYGTDTAGNQGAALVYDVWSPSQGTVPTSHRILPNTTATDIFCGNQTVLTTGQVVFTGGDLTVGGTRNFSNNKTTLFSPAANAVSAGPAMAYPRWYPTVVTLATGNVLVLGGRQDAATAATVPELYTPGLGYRALTGAASADAFGMPAAFYYPRAFLTPSGKFVVIGHDGAMFALDTGSAGSVTRLPTTAPQGAVELPSAAFAPGKVLSLRYAHQAVVVDASGAQPVVTATPPPSQDRFWSNLTVLADGKVLASGGSAVPNELTGVAYQTETWNPATRAWTPGAAAAAPRLYHSTALLLPDGTVLTAGGGSPGPVLNLNAQVYFPPYFFTADGFLAPRPAILQAPAALRFGQPFTAGVSGPVGRVTLLRTGSVTHSLDAEGVFLALPFTQSGGTVAVTPPASANLAPPGYYMLFVFSPSGVPSVARIVKLGA